MADFPKPLNTEERYQYEQLIRLDALCNMLSSLVEHIAKKENVATTNNEVVSKPTPRKRAKKVDK